LTEQLTPRGVVFWPVGTGDSTTIVVDEEIVVQVDLNDQAQADKDGSKVVAVVDQLAESLPPTGPDGMPYLAVFVLTHADVDHCRGFEDLLSEVAIGELWVTPRLWREYLDEGIELSAPAEAFRQEAERRIAATMAAGEDGPESGDRILVIGYDTDHEQHAYNDLPNRYLAWPGSTLTTLDGVDCTGKFEAFLHAPFKDDCAKARNDTSVAMQVTLADGAGSGRFLLFGDLKAATIGTIFEVSAANGNDDRLAWDVLLAPHHCSKHAVYDGDEVRQDILDALEANARPGARVVSSSHAFRDDDKPGDNPPHLKARDRYQEIVDEPVLCTMEHGSADAPSAVVFEVDAEGLHLLEPALVHESARSVEKAFTGQPGRLGVVASKAAQYAQSMAAASPGWWRPADPGTPGADRLGRAVASDRGDDTAPTTAVGFGKR
jgi:hypothetical protein